MRATVSISSRWKRASCVILALLSAPALAAAEDDGFGAPGQRVVSGAVGLELAIGSGFRGSDEVERDVTLGFAPSLLYFVARNLAVGISPTVAYADVDTVVIPYTEVEGALNFGVGWNLPLAGRVSLFPQLWLGAGYMHEQFDAWFMSPVYNDPEFAMSMPDPDYTVSGWFAAGTLLLPAHFPLGEATYVAVGARARLRVPFDEGTRLFRFGLTGGFGGFF